MADYSQLGQPVSAATPPTDLYASLGSPAPAPSVPTQNPDINGALQSHFESSIGAAKKANVGADGQEKPFSWEDALQAGWQNSVTGLRNRQALPNKVLPEDASFMQRTLSNIAQMGGDAPYIVEGAGLGLAGGFAAGGPVGGVAGTGAGGFGLPTAMRSILIDGYKNGEFKTPTDFLSRAAGIMWNTTKSMITGAATTLSGGVADAAVAGAGPVVKAVAPTAAQLFTMTELSKRLEGQVPKWSDFADGAAILFGFHAIGLGTDKLADIYKKTGALPSDVTQQAMADPVFKTELLSNQEVPASMQAAEEPATAAKPQTPNTPPVAGLTDEEAAAFKTVNDKIVTDFAEKEKPAYSFDKFYANYVDNFDPIKRVQEELTNGEKLPPSQDPYLLMRVSRGGYERANQFIEHNTVGFNDYKPNGESLHDALAGVQDDLDGLRTYMVAKRALELNDRGIDAGIDVEAARKIATSNSMVAKFDDAAQRVTDYSNRVLQYAKDGGLISQKTFDTFKEMNKNYVPFNRVLPDPQDIGAKPKTGNSPFKAIEGSDKDIIDPIATTIKNTYHVLTLTEQNYAAAQLMKAAKGAGEIGEDKLFEPVQPRLKATTVTDKEMQDYLKSNGIDKLPQDQLTVFRAMRQPLAPDEFAVFDKGERKVFSTGDQELANALKGVSPGVANPIVKFAAGFTRVFRSGTILNPDFLPRHVVRQNINAFINSENGLLPVYSALKTVSDRVFGDDDALLQKWRSGGGMNSEITAWDRRYIENSISKVEGEKPFDQFLEDAKNDPKSIASLPYNAANGALDLAHMAIAGHDNLLRFQEFKQSYQKYMDAGADEKDAIIQAAYDSREVLLDNFRRGAKMQAINSIWAFSNLRVQGVDKMFRNFADKPGITAAKLSGLIIIPTILNWWASHDDPRYKEAPDWERDNFWVIPQDEWRTPRPGDVLPTLQGMSRVNAQGQTEYNFGSTLRISKPQESGLLFGSSIERFLDFAQSHDPDTAVRLAKSLKDALAPEIVPSMATPLFEQWANKSMFTGGPIVSSSAENLLPAYQYSPYNTELSKSLGKVIGSIPGVGEAGGSLSIASPPVIENYVRQWTGGLGVYAMQLADYSLRKAGILPDPVKPAATLSDIPFIRAFVARFPSATTQSIEDFNHQYTQAKATWATVKFLAQQGNPQAAMAMARTAAEEPKLDGMHQAMSNIQHTILSINVNPSMSAQEKRQAIDKLYYVMIGMAQQGNAILKQVAAGANHGPVQGGQQQDFNSLGAPSK